MNRLNNERGFMLLNVVFLTLITSVAAMILMNAAPRFRNPQTALRLTAIHLANEQLAMIESEAAEGTLALNYLGAAEDLITENSGEPITFKVTATDKVANGLHNVTVKVTWTIDGENFTVEIERTIRVG